MINISLDDYDNTVSELLDIIADTILNKHNEAPIFDCDNYKQWVLRHIFIDVFEYTREFLLITILHHEKKFKFKPPWKINLYNLLEQLNMENISDLIKKCEEFNGIRNHLVHRKGLYYCDNDRKTDDLEFTFPSSKSLLPLPFVKKIEIQGRLNKLECSFEYGLPISLEVHHIANLIIYMRVNMFKILSKYNIGDISRNGKIGPSILEKLKYIYDSNVKPNLKCPTIKTH